MFKRTLRRIDQPSVAQLLFGSQRGQRGLSLISLSFWICFRRAAAWTPMVVVLGKECSNSKRTQARGETNIILTRSLAVFPLVL